MDAVVAIDAQSRVVFFNAVAEQMFGYSAAQALGAPVERFMPERFRDKHAEHVRRFAEADISSRRIGTRGEIRGLRANGDEFPIEASIGRIETDGGDLYTVVLRDMTERELAQRATRQREYYLRSLLDTVDAVIVLLGLDGTVLEWNPRAESFYGAPAIAVIGRPYADFIPAEERDAVYAEIKRIGREGTPTDRFESAVQTHRGLRHVVWNAALVADETGNPAILATGHDITEQKEAHEIARHLAAIVQSSDDAIIGTTLNGEIVSWNWAAQTIFGYTPDQAVGQPITMLSQEGQRGKTDQILERTRSGLRVDHVETLQVSKQGKIVPVSLSMFPVRTSNGEIVGCAAIARDITEQTLSREAHADLAGIIEESLNEIFVVDSSTLHFRAVNRGARENLGYSFDQLCELTLVDIMPEFSRERFEALIAPLRAAAKTMLQFETIHARKNGSCYPVEVHLQFGRYAGAERFVAIVLDITERKEAAQRETECERRSHKLEALASISTLTAGIAHDIGTPMTAILGYAEMMRKQLPDDKNRGRAAVIVEQVHRVSELVEALLDMARPGDRPFVPVDPAAVLRTSLELYRENLRKRNIGVEASLGPVPAVIGDAKRLQRVFINLIVNAADAMVNGGTLHVSLTNPDDRHVAIRIRDTGTGIAPEVLPRIFEPLYTTKERTSGTGLGLAVAKGIISEHGGEISATSQPGVGTEFTIVLPI